MPLIVPSCKYSDGLNSFSCIAEQHLVLAVTQSGKETAFTQF